LALEKYLKKVYHKDGENQIPAKGKNGLGSSSTFFLL